ncbi:MAG: GlsB/YeaQ/YmgE family stress response membrane protein [Desulfovibrionaceae bacterium]|nr:GlsB/YeaQ/YmgE family stress response membrane protein [Desulfovibrionaceae bacterium]
MNDLLWFLLVGLIAGWLAGVLVKGGGFGLVGDLLVGVLGAVIGGYLFGSAIIGVHGLLGSILVATLGAVILLVLLRVVRRLT